VPDDADPFHKNRAANSALEQALDTYFDFLKKSVSSLPSGGTQAGEMLRQQGVENLSAFRKS
jgi:hypothetical protein